MRHLILFLLFIPSTLHSQCPPPGFPDPGDNCGAPIICENLDGYCNTINNNNVSRPFPCCQGWTLNNDEWFGFFAGTTSISIEITPSNCDPGGQQGLQGGIYETCPPGNPSNNWCNNNVMDTQCSCTEDPFTLSSNDFVVGQVYWIVLDGCSGNVCDYSIDVTNGSTVPFAPDDPGPITGPASVCQGSSTVYQVGPVDGATLYNWTLSPGNAGTVTGTGPVATVVWAAGFSGSATLCLEVANQCYVNSNESCLDIEVLPPPTAQISGGGAICVSSGGSVDLTISLTGDPAWEVVYAWNGVPQPPIIVNASPYILTVNQLGTYTLVSVKSIDANPPCSGTVSGAAIVTGVSLTTSATATAATCGQPNGAIDFSVNGGNSPYTYNWSNGESIQDLSGVTPGVYSVTVTENTGCSATLSVTVNDIISNPTLSAVIGANTSCDVPNGTINLTPSPAGSYTYQWSNGGNTEDLDGLTGGIYTVTVTLGATCSATGSYNVTDVPNNPVATGLVTNATCDLANGSIQVSITGGVGPFTYLWDNGATTEDLFNAVAGDYELTVTGANGCTVIVGFTIGNDNPIFILIGTSSPQTDCDDPDGNVLLSINPGGNYTFQWSDGTTTQNLLGVAAGNYEVTVSAGGSCTQVGSYAVAYDPNQPLLSATTVPSTCNQANGSINLTVVGGANPYNYDWSTGATTQDLNGVFAGQYEVTVTGSNGCTALLTVLVENIDTDINLFADVTENTLCSGGNGGINLIVTPSNNYDFLWSNGATTEDIDHLSSGTYTVTVTLGNSCSEVGTFIVTNSGNLPNISATGQPDTCGLGIGSIQTTVSGGSQPISYLWSNGATTSDLDQLFAGTYEVTATDANQCQSSTSLDLTNIDSPFSIVANITPNTTCIGGNGSITVEVTPVGSYSFEWSNGATTSTLSQLWPETYEVSISQNGGCVLDTSFVVENQPNIPIVQIQAQPSICQSSNGSIDVTLTGGEAPFQFQWSNGATTEDIAGLQAGIYQLTVTGANSCVVVVNAEVVASNNNLQATLDSLVHPICFGDNSGTVSVSVTRGNGSYSYQWSTGDSTAIVTNLLAGSYTVTVMDSDQCLDTLMVSLMQPDSLQANASATSETELNGNDGTASANPIGGNAPYQYIWSNGGTSQTITGLSPGEYTVSVTDVNGCSVQATVYVSAYECALMSSFTTTHVRCFGEDNGATQVVMSGGTAPYQFQWSNGATTSSLNNLSPGVYGLIVSDAGNCFGFYFVEIQQPAILTTEIVQIQHVVCIEDSTGSVELNITGGTSPYTIHWPYGNGQQLVIGQYEIPISDSNGCLDTVAFAIVANDTVAPVLVCPEDKVVCGPGVVHYPAPIGSDNCDDPQMPVQVSGLPSGSFFENGLTVNTYVVSDAQGNTSSCSFSVTVVDAPLILINSIMHDVNSQGVGAILITVIGSGGYTYSWTKDGQLYSNQEDLTGLGAGVYGLVLSDLNGCTASIPPILISNFVGQENPGLEPFCRLLPNPATDFLYIEVANALLASVSICDMQGVELKSIHAEELGRGVFIGALPSGMYVLKAQLSGGRLWVEKWIKQ